MLLPLNVWAWILVTLAALNLGIQGVTALVLLRLHLRRHRPLMRAADAIERGDLGQARFLIEAIPGEPGAQLAGFCGRAVETDPPDVARNRFLRGYLATYPAAPLGAKLLTVVACGATALLPFLIGAAGRADALAQAAHLGGVPSPLALDLYRLGMLETAAAGTVAGALVLVAHRADPGARAVRRRLTRSLGGRSA